MFNALFDELEVRPVISNVVNISDGITALSYGVGNITSDRQIVITSIQGVVNKLTAIHGQIKSVVDSNPSCCGDIMVRLQ